MGEDVVQLAVLTRPRPAPDPTHRPGPGQPVEVTS